MSYLPPIPRDSGLHNNKAMGCAGYVFVLLLVGYALLGLFFGFLIVPDLRRGRLNEDPKFIEGPAARIGGAGFLLLYLAVYLLMRDGFLDKTRNRWAFAVLMLISTSLLYTCFNYDAWFN